MTDYEQVSITIPPKGRVGVKSLNRLIKWELLPEKLSSLNKVIARTEKKRSTVMGAQSEMQNEVTKFWNQGVSAVNVLSDRERPDRPLRLGFFRYDTNIDGIKVVVEGEDHYTAPQLVKSHQADIIFAGWDEVYAALIDQMYIKGYARKWHMFNESLAERSTDFRILGSAFLEDYVGHFIITPEQKKGRVDKKDLWNSTVYISPVYAAIYQKILDNCEEHPLKLTSVDHVEDKVRDDPNSIGIALVESGKTINQKSLYVAGKPILQSETVIGFNQERYNEFEEVRKIVGKMQPIKYIDKKRLESHEKWYNHLAKNLGDRWADKPEWFRLFYDRPIDRVFIECFK